MSKLTKRELQISLSMVSDYALEQGDTSIYNSPEYRRTKEKLVEVILEEKLDRLKWLEDERQETLQKLRLICNEFGDNTWPDNLYIPDIIEKFLLRSLRYDEARRLNECRKRHSK